MKGPPLFSSHFLFALDARVWQRISLPLLKGWALQLISLILLSQKCWSTERIINLWTQFPAHAAGLSSMLGWDGQTPGLDLIMREMGPNGMSAGSLFLGKCAHALTQCLKDILVHKQSPWNTLAYTLVKTEHYCTCIRAPRLIVKKLQAIF